MRLSAPLSFPLGGDVPKVVVEPPVPVNSISHILLAISRLPQQFKS